MLAYKGFDKHLTGHGQYRFKPGQTVTEESSQTANSGFHCCENPFECLTYFPLQRENRYWQVEASGSIDEDGYERIACTEMTLIKELTLKEFVGHGMAYIVQHPMREKWEQNRSGIRVAKEKAEGTSEDFIAIARGKHPKVKGVEGSILGLILESEKGQIVSAKLFVPDRQQEGKWYTIDADRNLREVHDEEEDD